MTSNRQSSTTRSGALLALAALLGTGCAAFTTMDGPSVKTYGDQPRRVAGTDLLNLKGAVHCHSYLSHDSEGTIEEIAEAAAVAGLDFVAMTDHRTDEAIHQGYRGRIGRTLFLVGAEVRTPQGTLLAFPLHAPLRRWMSAGALVAEARRQGAATFINALRPTPAPRPRPASPRARTYAPCCIRSGSEQPRQEVGEAGRRLGRLSTAVRRSG